VDEVSPGDVENADAIAIGLATYKGAGMPMVIKFAESLANVPLKGKVGTSFGNCSILNGIHSSLCGD